RLVRGQIWGFKPDVLHVHYGTTAAIVAGELASSAKPFLISFYGFDVSQGIKIPAVRVAYERLFQKQPLVHVLCDEARDRLISVGLDQSLVVDANLPLPVELYPNIGIAAEG